MPKFHRIKLRRQSSTVGGGRPPDPRTVISFLASPVLLVTQLLSSFLIVITMRNQQVKLTPAQELLLSVTDQMCAHLAASLHYYQLRLPEGNHGDHPTNVRWIREMLEKRSREIAGSAAQKPGM